MILRRDGRVVDGGGLENRFPERGRGFESYSLRHEIESYWTQINADEYGFMATKYSVRNLGTRMEKEPGPFTLNLDF
jgi:hypothetical protein